MSAAAQPDIFDQVLGDTPSSSVKGVGPDYGSSKPVERGNIQWYNRDKIPMPEGKYGTVYSESREENGLEVLYPRIYGGKVHSGDEAWQHYKQTGEHMGKFRNAEDADSFAEKYHNDAAAGKYDNAPSSQGDIFDQVLGAAEPPKKYLPEVEKAIKTVPRPDSPLNYAEPGNDVTGAVTGFFPSRTPRTPAKVAPYDVQRAVVGGLTDIATGSGMPSDMGSPPLGEPMAQHVREMETPGKRGTGALGVAATGAEALTPLMGPATLENPASIIRGLAEGTAASKAGGYLLKKAGVSDENVANAETLLFWAPGVARSVLQPKFGAAVSPKEFVVRGGVKVPIVGDVAVEVRIPRSQPPAPAGAIEEPLNTPNAWEAAKGNLNPREALTGQPSPPPPSDDPAITSMVASRDAEVASAKQAAGIPPPPLPAPPRIVDQPNAPPELQHGQIPQKLVDSFASVVKALPENLRSQAIQEAHKTLTQVLIEGSQHGPMVGPDGKLIQMDEGSAPKVALKLINDAISAHDKVSAAALGEARGGKAEAVPAPAASAISSASAGDIFDQVLGASTVRVKGLQGNEEEAIPLGGNRVSGSVYGTTDKADAEHVLKQIQGKQGFENARVEKHGSESTDEVPSYMVEYGQTVPEARTGNADDYRKIGRLYGYPENEIESFIKKNTLPGGSGSGSPAVGTETQPADRSKETAQETGTQKNAPVVSAEQPTALKKGDQAILTKDTAVGEKTLPAGSKVTIQYVHPKGMLVRATAEDGTKFSRGMGAFSKGVESVNGNHGNQNNGKSVPATGSSSLVVGKQDTGVPVEHGEGDLRIGSKTEVAGAEVPKYKFGNTQANIPAESEASKALESARSRISESDLAGKGKDIGDGGNHVTVRYGIKGEDTEGIKKFLSQQVPFEASLGKTESFPPSEHSDGAAVIQAPIESPELRRLNAELEKHGEFTEPSFKEYKPHATIAYVKPEKVGRYEGMDVTHGKKFTVNEIAVSKKDGSQEIVKLGGKREVVKRSKEAIDKDIDALTAKANERQNAATDQSIRGLRPAAVDWMSEDELQKLHALQLERHPYTAEENSPELARQRVEAKRAARIAPEPTQNEADRQKVGLPPTAGKVGEMNVRDLKVAPHRFQYKLATDAEGVSTLLKDVTKYDPELAGVISVWHDSADHKTYVVNGHHRYELAKRTGQKSVTVRHIVAPTAEAARAIGALQNIAEGRGTAIDAAKFFRDSGLTPEQLKEKGIALGEKTASDGLAMSKLEPSIFQKVVSGDLRQGRAIAIGESTADPAEQKAILSLVEKKERSGAKVSDDTLSELIRLVKGSEQTTETTSNLFGTQEITRSLALEKAEISAHIKQQLSKDKKLFGFVAKEGRATELARAGNKIDVEKSKEISVGAAQAEEVYNLLSARGGPIASILDEAARKLADGESAGEVKSDAYTRIRAEVSQTLRGGERGSAERPEGTPESGQDTGVSLFSPETQLAPPFYSKAARIAFDKLPSSMSGDSALATLKNAGVKADEIKWIGLDDFLSGKPKVSKQDVLSYVWKNLVQVREVTKGVRTAEQQQAIDEAHDKVSAAEQAFFPIAAKELAVADPKEDSETQAKLLASELQTSSLSPGELLTYHFRSLGRVRGINLDYAPSPSADLTKAAITLYKATRDLRQVRKANQTPTKYESYTLPGEKKNYTELLLTLPSPPRKVMDTIAKEMGFGGWTNQLTEGQKDKVIAAFDRQPSAHEPFTTSHFDEPNILAHVRFDERTDADGKPILFVEEVQSDWHQKGKKVGYRDSGPGTNHALAKEKAEAAWQGLKPLLAKAENLGYDHLPTLRTDIANGDISSDNVLGESPELRNAMDRYHDSFQEMVRANRPDTGVPNAPFKSDWHELAMKTMLRKAAEGGYDKIGWVTGEQTADRYDLSKHIDRLGYTKRPDGKFDVSAAKDGKSVFAKDGLSKQELADTFGKDLAERIDKETPDIYDRHNGNLTGELTGLQLKVGGEWAKNLYDRAIPNFLSKYGKKWGAKVGEAKIVTANTRNLRVQERETTSIDGTRRSYIVYDGNGYEHGEFQTVGQAKDRLDELRAGTNIHSLSITPEMRASVLSEGQPLFSAATGPILVQTAKAIDFKVKPTTKELPPYLELNPEASEAISRALGVRVKGVNFDAKMVPEIVTKLKAQADKMERINSIGAGKLRDLADALLGNADKNFGVSVIRTSEDKAEQLATLHEEMIHSGQRAAGGGDISRSVPWTQSLASKGMRTMASRRIIPHLLSAGIVPDPSVVVAEAMVDIMRGDAWEITDEQAEETATKYYEAMAKRHGTEAVQRLQDIENFIAQEAERLGVTYGRQSVREAGRQALAAVLSGKTGTAIQRTGKSTTSGPEAIAGRGPETSLQPGNPGEEFGGRAHAATGGALASTQPIGLTDEELDQWSKAKGFRIEPAGEQLGMFGGNEPVLRVFRTGAKGKEQAGLVYQSQLDKLNSPKEEEPLPEFSLTGGEEKESQPALFGAGDLGEIIGGGAKGSGIELPAKERDAKGTSLFHTEKGDRTPVGSYLREAKHATDLARNLQRGLETLDTQKQADILRAAQAMKDLKEQGYSKPDDAAIYHHFENPEGESLTPAQDRWLDDTILPIADRNSDLYTELTDGGIPIENYVHRVVKGKGGMLDRIAQGVKAIGQKATLSKSAPQTKSRTYMALESQDGERQVVSIKGGQVTAWNHGAAENLGGISHTDEGKVFEDKDGKIWNLKQATTKEIEANTGTVYYHSALASTLASNIQLEAAVRAMRFLEAFKASPDFKEISFEIGKGNPPKDWKTTNLPQFKGYAFEPRTAEVLDWYYDRMRQGNIGALEQVGQFMRVAMLLNPIMHPMNVAASWAIEKGATGFLMPQNFKTAWKSGNKAAKAVISKNQDFLDALDAGAPLQSHREAIKDITKLFFDQLGEGLDKEEPWAMKVAKSLGIEHGNLLNILHKISSKAAWMSNDILFLQSAYENQAKNPGMSLQDALKETGRIIPEYRVPTRILDSPAISKLMTNRWATIFGSYHYGLLKSFGEVAKSALGAQEPAPGRTKAEEVAKGWDRLAMIALVTMALYPILDELAKKATGDKHARVRRAGPFGLVDAASQVAKHEQSISTAAQRVVTPAPQTKAAAELAFNREFYAGHQIYDPHATFPVQTEQIGRYLLGEMGQIGQVEKAQTTEQKKRFAWGQAGVSFHKSAAEKAASDIAMSKVGTQAEDPEDQNNRVLRREILEQLRKGNHKPLQEAQAKHEITAKQVKSLEHRARLTPLQDTIHGFSYSEARKVYEVASPEEKKEIDPIMRQKRTNMFKAGRGREITSATP